MIETKAEVSKDLEKALQALEQAKQRVTNEKKKQNEKKRKAENHHKYISKIKSENRETTPPQSTIHNAENENEGDTECREQRN